MGWGEEVSPHVSPEELERLQAVDQWAKALVWAVDNDLPQLSNLCLAHIRKVNSRLDGINSLPRNPD